MLTFFSTVASLPTSRLLRRPSSCNKNNSGFSVSGFKIQQGFNRVVKFRGDFNRAVKSQ
jgi:hypothetical protein